MKPDKDMVTRIEDVSKKLKEDPNGQYDDEAAGQQTLTGNFDTKFWRARGAAFQRRRTGVSSKAPRPKRPIRFRRH